MVSIAHKTVRTTDGKMLNDGQQTDFGCFEQKPQNAIVVLNVMRPAGVLYKLKSCTGPDHDPIFTMTIVVIHYCIVIKKQFQTNKRGCINFVTG